MQVLKLPLGDASARQFALLASVLAVLVEEVHAGEGQHNEGFHESGPGVGAALPWLRWLVQLVRLRETRGLRHRRLRCGRRRRRCRRHLSPATSIKRLFIYLYIYLCVNCKKCKSESCTDQKSSNRIPRDSRNILGAERRYKHNKPTSLIRAARPILGSYYCVYAYRESIVLSGGGSLFAVSPNDICLLIL